MLPQAPPALQLMGHSCHSLPQSKGIGRAPIQVASKDKKAWKAAAVSSGPYGLILISILCAAAAGESLSAAAAATGTSVELLSCMAHKQEVDKLCSIGAINEHARASKSNAPGNKAITGIRLFKATSFLVPWTLSHVAPTCTRRVHPIWAQKEAGLISCIVLFVTSRHPTYGGLQTYVKHAPSGGSAVTTAGTQQQPLDSCNAQQDRSFRLLQGIAAHAEGSLQSRAVADMLSLMATTAACLIRCCARNMQCNITRACSIFKHFCVIDFDV